MRDYIFISKSAKGTKKDEVFFNGALRTQPTDFAGAIYGNYSRRLLVDSDGDRQMVN
jgi:hypothetical protein